VTRKRIGRIIGYALSRITAYLVVGLVFLAVVVAIIGGWPTWVILASIAGGLVVLGLLVVDALLQPSIELDVSIADIDIKELHNAALREKVRRALEYNYAALKLARHDKSGVLDLADNELPQLSEAARSIYQMCLRLQEFRADRLIERDFAELQRQREIHGQLTSQQEAQLQALERLNELVRSAEREIDSALAHLGRSYAEMQAIKVTPELRGRAGEALEELETSTKRLSDLAQGYDEVYRGGALPKES